MADLQISYQHFPASFSAAAQDSLPDKAFLYPTSFESYTKEGFDIESHRRLADVFRELTERGCYCMLTNHNTDFINQLYADFNKVVVDVKRMINSDAKNRVGQEIIITNY